MDRSCKTFLHVQQLLLRMGMSLRDRPRSRFALARVAQLEDVKGWLRFQRCLPMVATFHSANFFMPSPPSFKGCVRSSQATLAPPGSRWGTFHRNLLKTCSTCWMIFFGRINRPFQNDWILHRTYFMSWRHPAKDKNLAVQLVALDVMESTKGLQCIVVNFVEIRGTPR